MINYNDLKNGDLVVKKGTIDCYKAGEMVVALGFDKEKSDFDWLQYGMDIALTRGVVVLKGELGRKISVIE